MLVLGAVEADHFADAAVGDADAVVTRDVWHGVGKRRISNKRIHGRLLCRLQAGRPRLTRAVLEEWGFGKRLIVVTYGGQADTIERVANSVGPKGLLRLPRKGATRRGSNAWAR